MRSFTRTLIALSLLAGAAPLAADTPDSTSRADELRARAEALYDTPRLWSHAADLLKQSAHLRDDGDPEKVRTLVASGRVYGQARRFENARRTLARAGDLALERGFVFQAASAYMEAAHAAARAGSVGAATRLVEKARALSNSPHLSTRERAALQSWTA